MSELTDGTSCLSCYGSGQRHDLGADHQPITRPCWSCYGTGRELTALGSAIAQFLLVHYKLTAKREYDE